MKTSTEMDTRRRLLKTSYCTAKAMETIGSQSIFNNPQSLRLAIQEVRQLTYQNTPYHYDNMALLLLLL